MPATRTPEGEPLKCDVCKTISFVLVSSTSDSVCPSCGSFAWISIDYHPQTLLTQTDLVALPAILNQMQSAKTRFELSDLLAEGLKLLLKCQTVRIVTIPAASIEQNNSLRMYPSASPAAFLALEVFENY